ncbi:hypothetical protein [Streptomyces sp. NBC_01435]|uniref:hypothetical protein n=1 Tax=Streptomyces sp. NBC_01435 TaxID=2903865 RepID=UPI002E33E9F0|nr:hypothetical protein [Streptomyces sp. NBC_01435]
MLDGPEGEGVRSDDGIVGAGGGPQGSCVVAFGSGNLPAVVGRPASGTGRFCGRPEEAVFHAFVEGRAFEGGGDQAGFGAGRVVDVAGAQGVVQPPQAVQTLLEVVGDIGADAAAGGGRCSRWGAA